MLDAYDAFPALVLIVRASVDRCSLRERLLLCAPDPSGERQSIAYAYRGAVVHERVCHLQITATSALSTPFLVYVKVAC